MVFQCLYDTRETKSEDNPTIRWWRHQGLTWGRSWRWRFPSGAGPPASYSEGSLSSLEEKGFNQWALLHRVLQFPAKYIITSYTHLCTLSEHAHVLLISATYDISKKYHLPMIIKKKCVNCIIKRCSLSDLSWPSWSYSLLDELSRTKICMVYFL